jgi:methylmalonyl-CoA mutase N-terminal domain/subunit
MFGRRNNKSIVKENVWQDKAADKIAGAGIKLQQKFSTSMNKIFSDIPVNKIKIIFTLFCLTSGSYSIYLAAHSILDGTQKSPSIKIDNVNVLQHFNQNYDPVRSKQYVTEEIYQEIQGYKKYMDSIGQPIRQSLMDSITILEEIYQSQNIK